MSVFKQTMQPGQQDDFPGSGNYIYVYSGTIRVTTSTGRVYELNARDGLATNEFKSLRIESREAIAAEIHLKTLYGEYRPGGSTGAAVEVVNRLEVDVMNPQTSIAINNEVINKLPSQMIGHVAITLPVGGQATIPANVNPAQRRTEVFIFVDANVVGDVWLGSSVAETGLPVGAGSRSAIAGQSSIDIFGPEGAKIFWAENVELV